METTSASPLLDSRQVAEHLGVSDRWVRELVSRGVLPAVRFERRGRLRFRPEDVEAALDRHRTKAAA